MNVDDLVHYHVGLFVFSMEIKAILGEGRQLHQAQDMGSSSSYLHHPKDKGKDGLTAPPTPRGCQLSLTAVAAALLGHTWGPAGPCSSPCCDSRPGPRLPQLPPPQFRTGSQKVRSPGSASDPPQHPPPLPTLPRPNINLLTGNALKKRHLPASRRMPRK